MDFSNFYSGATANEAWQKAAVDFKNDQRFREVPSRLGDMLEIPRASFHIENPRERWVSSRKPAINPAFAIAEVVWILAGREDSKFINHWNPILPKFAGNDAVYHGAYGARLRYKFCFDQIERAYNILKNNKITRQVTLQIWCPELDMPSDDGEPRAADIPCNVCSMLKIRDSKLEWTQVMRSNDFILGTPHNFVQFTSLQEIMAGWLGLEAGSYHQLCDSLHIYKNDYGSLESSMSQNHVIPNTDRLDISKDEFEKAFPSLLKLFDSLTDSQLSKQEFNSLISSSSQPDSYMNLLYIASADTARRRGWEEEAMYASGLCANPALKQLWDSWYARCESRSQETSNE
jgi:thymidylate synthase